MDIIQQRKEFKVAGDYGISFLDDMLIGILPEDLVLIGASSGCGKSEFAYQIAFRNSLNKHVHLFALEADVNEPYHRMAYRLISDRYFKDVKEGRRPANSLDMSYRNYITNQIDVSEYDGIIKEMIEKYYRLHVHYRSGSFTVDSLLEKIAEAKMSGQCDMIIIDHIDYFDTDPRYNENTQVSMIMSTIRDINKELGIPIIVISHLRKPEGRTLVIPEESDFMGTSNKPKQAKTVILIARHYEDDRPEVGLYSTLFYVPKLRVGGGENFVGRCMYSRNINSYLDNYDLYYKKRGGESIEPVPSDRQPKWAHRSTQAKYQSIFTSPRGVFKPGTTVGQQQRGTGEQVIPFKAFGLAEVPEPD